MSNNLTACSYLLTNISWIHGAIDTVILPTHFYKIFAKCQTTSKLLGARMTRTTAPCQGKLDVISFILPHINSLTPQGQVKLFDKK